jgi:hypothetical protein
MTLVGTIIDESKDALLFVAIVADDMSQWSVAATVFEDGNPKITVTSSHRNLNDATVTVQKAIERAEMDFAKGMLLLPDMGDYTVEYHTDST